MISDYYENTYTIYTNSGSVDSYGDYTESTSSFATGICKLTPNSGRKAIRLTEKGEVWADYRIYMDPVVGITEFKNIVIDDNLYEILFIANRLGNHLEIDAQRID